MAGDHALGIDVGTTNVKVVLVAPDGSTRARAARRLPMEHQGDRAEQDAAALWSAVVDATREVIDACPESRHVLGVVGVCSQYSSTVPVAADGTPVGPLITWLDQRGTDACWAIAGAHADAFGTWIERHGIPPIGAGLSLAHMLFMQHEQPHTHQATAAYLEVMDYVIARLTGTIAATQCTQFATQLCDNRSVGTLDYDPDLVAMAGVDPTRLPALLPIDGVVGPVRPDVADRLGVAHDVIVHVGINDSHAGAYATGAGQNGRAGIMIGTTAVVLDTCDHLAVDLDREILAMPAPQPGTYLVWAENGVSGRAVEHALGEWFAGGDDPFASLDAVCAQSSPGANGVLFLPWLAGSLAPRAVRAMRGGYLNCGLGTTRADLIRATIEGTARNLRWLLGAVEDFVGRPVERIAFGGGAARSAAWAQTLADVLHRPVMALDDPGFANARATALAALARREGGDPSRDPRLEPAGTLLEPDPAAAAEHDALQAQFEAAFTATRPIHEALSRYQAR